MGNKGLFKKYYSRLAVEGIIKALICGLIAGLAISLVSAFVAFMLNNFNLFKMAGLLISIGIGVAVALIATPIFYYTLFRPVTKKIAERVDRLGLEERLVTMMELEKDESYIAMRQREDAKSKLNTVSRRQLKLSIFIVPIVVLALVAASSITMISVSAASFDEKLEWEAAELRTAEEVDAPVRLPDEEYTYFTVEYLVVMGGGYIAGDLWQVVIKGENSTAVVATPYSGYVFTTWIASGSNDPKRIEENVQENIFDFAQFDPESDEEDETPSPGPDESEEFDPNVIIDGTKYLGDEGIPDYVTDALNKIAAGEKIPDALRKLVQLYFDTIKPDVVV